MPSLRDTIVGLAVASLLENVAINRLAPELLLSDRFSRSILRFFFINLVLYLAYDVFFRPFFLSPLRHLPGPKDTSIIGETRTEGVYREPGKTFLEWVKTIPNDGVIRFRGIFNRDRLLLTSEESLRSVLGEHSYDYVKPTPIRSFLTQILGNGLILVEGDEHKFQRKHVIPAFQLKQLRNLYPIFWEKSRQLIEILESEMKDIGPKGSIEFGVWATRVTLDIIGVAGMGRDFHSLKNADDELVSSYNELLHPSKENGAFFAVNIILGSRLTKLLPWHLNKKLARVTGVLKRYCLDLVADRKKELQDNKASDRKDIITELIRSNDFKDSELADQMLTFLAAGHETTSSAITWLCYLLAKNQDHQDTLRAEIRASLPSPNDTSNIPSAAEIDALPFLNAVCSETLRLYPTVPVTIREAIHPTTITLSNNGKRSGSGSSIVSIPKGTRVLISPWATNRSPLIWGPDAESFVPERWMGEGKAQTGGQASNYSQITFLHGARSCIGQGFAKAELKCLAAAILGRFRVRMGQEDWPVYPAGVVTIKPGQGMPLRFERVEGW